ncbi:ABC transporter permease [Rhodococcus spongiicola]|uniref:ABC transporter permease n=1 Tax=Rhodococcus spongiicola TaxID=2487352 RepID=A0A3S3ABZ8_9NOCA|nr:ABC transporter permease [Rhodococcus spongiicola]
MLFSEFRKFATLRFWWALGLAPLFAGVLAGLISVPVVAGVAGSAGSHELASLVDRIGLLVTLPLIVVCSALFGALHAGTEYRHDTMTTTVLIARSRDAVVAAKLLVGAAFGFLCCLVVAIVGVSTVLLIGSDGVRFDGTLAAILVVALVASTLWALIGSGLALSTRSSTATAVGIVAWLVLEPGVVATVLDGVHLEAVGRWLPGSVTVAAFHGIGRGDLGGSAGGGGDASVPTTASSLVGLAVWATLACGLGWWATRTRDLS